MIRTLLEELIGRDERQIHMNTDFEISLRSKLRKEQRQRIPEIEGKIRALLPEKHEERPYKFFDGGYTSELAAYVDGYNTALNDMITALGLTGKDTE